MAHPFEKLPSYNIVIRSGRHTWEAGITTQIVKAGGTFDDQVRLSSTPYGGELVMRKMLVKIVDQETKVYRVVLI